MTAEALCVQQSEEFVEVLAGARLLARYNLQPELPAVESPKPFLHPVRTLAGTLITAMRPPDHPWHKGVQFTLTDVSGHNFWGGPTYDPAANTYVQRDNVGSQQQESLTVREEPDAVVLDQHLTWLTAKGVPLLTERRHLRFFGVEEKTSSWRCRIDTVVKGVGTTPLLVGSPATLGRTGVGYSGLFWRGPTSWSGTRIGTSSVDSGGPEWISVTGRSSTSGRAACVSFSAGAPSPAAGVFVRNDDYVGVALSPSFSQPVTIGPGSPLQLEHHFVVADAASATDELTTRTLGFSRHGQGTE